MSLNLDKSGWTPTTFGEVVRNVNITVKDPASTGIDRVIAMEHLDPGELKIQRWGNLADGTTFTRRVKPGQTLFGKRRAYQRKVAYAEFDAICSGDILAFEADAARLLPELLPFIVQSEGFFDHALGTSAGSLSPRTNWRDLSDYEFLLPGLDDQKRIADLLWAIETHRSRTSELAKLQSEAERTWTTQVLESLEWNTPLAELVKPERPLCYGVVQPGIDAEAGVRLIRVMDLESGSPRLSDLKCIAEEIDQQYRRSRVSEGDVLVSIVGTIGRTWIVTSEFEGCNVARALARIAPNPVRVSPAFLQWVLSSPQVQAALNRAAFESARKTLNLSALAAVLVPHADLNQQAEMVTQREVFRRVASTADAELRALSSLKSSLLADFFGGD